MRRNTEAPAAPERVGATLDPVLAFMQLLWAVDHGLQSTSKRMRARHGITGPQRLVIRIVGRSPGIGAGPLAAVLHLHPSTLTGVLKRLEERGLIRRKTDPADSRRALFDLTKKGEAVDQIRSGTVEAAVRRTMSLLPPQTLAAAQQVLAALAVALDAEG